MGESQWPTHKVTLTPPPLEELAAAVRSTILADFSLSEVSISTPPDLRESPFYLAGSGLSGNTRIADVGGPPNLKPTPNLNAKYDLICVSEVMEMPQGGGILLGASAGPFHVLGRNTELMPNIAYGSASDGMVNNCTHYAKVADDGSVLCEKIGDSTEFGLMGNLFGCDGRSGPILHIKAKGRIGKCNFTESIQRGIQDVYGTKLVSLGGVFLIRTGRTKLHVMPDFPSKPFESKKDFDEWMQYYDTDAPLVCLSVLHTGDDQGLALRMEHTHCFGVGPDKEKRGGHYHWDLDDTMQDVDYEGWFNLAEVLYRIDQPSAGHQPLS